MQKLRICVLFGGVSSEHEVSRRSAVSVLENMDREKYDILPVGITRDGRWMLYTGQAYGVIDSDAWESDPGNLPAWISPDRTQGLTVLRDGKACREAVSCVFPVLHGENGEDGAMQGLLQLAGLAYVGSGVQASANSMDKVATHTLSDFNGIRQAGWESLDYADFVRRPEKHVSRLERRFGYPLFIKPAGTGSSVGVTKVKDRDGLLAAVALAGKYDNKVLAQEFIDGREIEVAVLGNREPVASVCGEITPGAEFYTYEAKYISTTSELMIPAPLPEDTAELLRETAVRVYKILGCRGLARVDFFVHRVTGAVIFNEINTMPGFTSISMYPKLFAASGIPYPALIDRLIELALEKN